MNEKLKSAFQQAKYEPNANLADSIWQKIIIYNKRITFIKLSVFSILGVMSLIGLIPVFKALFTEFAKSGFYEYLSILFSNNGELASYWKELTYSIAESLPIMNIVYVFVLILTLFLSIKYIARQIISNKYIGRSYGVV